MNKWRLIDEIYYVIRCYTVRTITLPKQTAASADFIHLYSSFRSVSDTWS